MLSVLALALVVVAARAWWHTRSQRVLFLAVGFLLFLAKGALLSYGLFRVEDWGRDLILPMVVLDLGILAMFYLAVLRRSRA